MVRAGALAARSIRIGHDASSLDLLRQGGRDRGHHHPRGDSRRPTPNWWEARCRGIPVVMRPAVLAKLMAGHTTLMVSGTHGRDRPPRRCSSSPCSTSAGRDPSFAVGGELGEPGTNAHHGSGDRFVAAEADESDGSLLEYRPGCGGGHQHRGRPSGLLRQFRCLHRGVRLVCGANSPRWSAGDLCRRRRRGRDSPSALRHWASGCCATVLSLRQRSNGPADELDAAAVDLGATWHRRGRAHSSCAANARTRG